MKAVVCVGIMHVSRHLKEELAWATDEQLQVASTTMYDYTTEELMYKAFLVQNNTIYLVGYFQGGNFS